MSQDVRKILAKNIESLRTKLGLTREKLSLELGLDNSYISKLENEQINIRLDTLIKIAEKLDVKVKDLFS